VDEPTSVRKFRVAPRASYAPLDRLPGRFRAGRSGWPKAQFGSTMGSFCMIGILTEAQPRASRRRLRPATRRRAHPPAYAPRLYCLPVEHIRRSRRSPPPKKTVPHWHPPAAPPPAPGRRSAPTGAPRAATVPPLAHHLPPVPLSLLTHRDPWCLSHAMSRYAKRLASSIVVPASDSESPMGIGL
jgi:hypothetical protein